MSTTRPAWSDDDIEAFRDLAHTFLTRSARRTRSGGAEQQHVDREVWNKAGELGLLCPSIPEQYGGGGGTFAHEAVMMEEQTRTLAPSLGTAVHSTIVAPLRPALRHRGAEAEVAAPAWPPASSSAPSP